VSLFLSEMSLHGWRNGGSSTSSGSRSFHEVAVEEGITQVRDHFANLQLFDYEAVAGTGAFGVAFRILDRTVEGNPRRLIVKKALGRQTAGDVSREIETLKVRLD
jgi:hypothetical protein